MYGNWQWQDLIAVTTDNPTVMQAFRRKFKEAYPWVLVSYFLRCSIDATKLNDLLQTFACILHQLNTLIGDIMSYPEMKKVVSQTTCIVSFFNSSHYWGGQLDLKAKKQGISRKMKQHCETCFYSLILQCLSVLAYQYEVIYCLNLKRLTRISS